VEWPSFESKDDFDQVLKALREIDPNTDFYLLQFILKKFKLSDAQKKNPTDVLWKMAKASIAGFEKDYRKAFGHKFKEFFEERLKWKPDRMSLEAMALDQAQAQDESQKVLNISYLVKRISEETDPVKLERLVRLAAIPEDVKKSLVEHLKQYNEAVKDSESLLKDAPDAFDRLGALVQSIFV